MSQEPKKYHLIPAEWLEEQISNLYEDASECIADGKDVSPYWNGRREQLIDLEQQFPSIGRPSDDKICENAVEMNKLWSWSKGMKDMRDLIFKA